MKLRVQCPQAPLMVKDRLKQHLKLHGFADNVVRIQWRTSRKAKGFSIISFAPPHMVDDAILKLNGSMLLAQYKLQVKRYKKKHRGGRDRHPKKGKAGEKTKVFVGSLPKFIDEQHLRNHFQSFHEHISRIEVLEDKETKQSKGCGFVFFSSRPPAERAVLALNGTLLLNKHKIKVEFAKGDRKMSAESVSSVSSMSEEMHQHTKAGDKTKVFVGSLPKFVNEPQLKKHFQRFQNDISRIEVLSDKETKECKGCAFVFFSSRPLAEQAVFELNGTLLLNKHKIKVEFAKEDKKTSFQPPAMASPPSEKGYRNPYLPSVSGSQKSFDQDTSDSESVCSASSTSGEFCNVFINSQPPLQDIVKEKHVRDHLSRFQADILKVKVIKDRKSKKCKGYAVATFSSKAKAEEVVESMNNSVLLGQFKLNLHCKSEKKQPSPTKISKTQADTFADEREINTQFTEISSPEPSQSASSKPSPHAVKLTCLPKTVTSDDLYDILQQYGELIGRPKIFESKNRYALANFSSLSCARNAVTNLDKFVMHGCTIKVHLKESPNSSSTTSQRETAASGVFQSQPPLLNIITGSEVVPSRLPVAANAGMGVTVTVDNLDPLIGISEIQAMVGVPIVKFERVSSSTLIHFSSHETAQAAVNNLNGKSLLGKTIRAYMNNTAVSPQVNHPKFLPGQDAFQYPVQSGIGPVPSHHQPQGIPPVQPYHQPQGIPSVPPYHQPQGIPPEPPYHQPQGIPPEPPYHRPQGIPPEPPYHQPQGIPSVSSLASAEHQMLKLSPEQWNRIMNVRPAGTSLFHEIIEPYKTNKSIEIKPDMETLSIHFTGVREAITSAYRRLDNEVNKEIQVPDR